MVEGTAYIDFCGGRWEAWHNAEGRRWPMGYHPSRYDAKLYCKKRGFARVVDCTLASKPDPLGYLRRMKSMGRLT